MRCSECGYEWNALLPDAVRSETCPSCGQKMRVHYESFSSLTEGVCYVIGIYAKKNQKEPCEILKHPNTFCNYLKDLLGNSYPEKDLLHLVMKSDVPHILYQASALDEKERNTAVIRAENYLQTEYAMESQKAVAIVTLLTTALGWNFQTKNFSLPESPKRENAVLPESPKKENTVLPELPKKENTVLPESPKKENTVLPESSKKENTVLPELPKAENVILPENMTSHSHKVQKTVTSSESKTVVVLSLILLILIVVVVALIIAVYRQNTKSVVSLEENETSFTQMTPENEMLENSNTEPLTELEKEEIQAEIIETAPSVIENVVEETQPPETEPATIVASVSQIPQRPDYSGIFRRTQAELSQYIRRFFYSYQDLDCDGIEELIVSYGEMSDTDNNYIYTYQNGSPVYVGEVSAVQGHLCFIPAKHLIIGCDVADGDGVAYQYSIYEMKGTSLEFIESYEYYDGGMDNEPYFRHNGQNADSQEVLDALNDYEVQSIMLEITEYRE